VQVPGRLSILVENHCEIMGMHLTFWFSANLQRAHGSGAAVDLPGKLTHDRAMTTNPTLFWWPDLNGCQENKD
jgi:hypothetical protein